MPSASSIEQLRTLFSREGVQAGLAWLNAGVGHRYTGIFRFSDRQFHNVALHDKFGAERPDYLAVIDAHDSFCQFVLRDGSFQARDTASMPILKGHRFQGIVVAYHGVPIPDRSGGLYGTISHFDLVKQPLAEEEFQLLEAAGASLYPFLQSEPRLAASVSSSAAAASGRG